MSVPMVLLSILTLGPCYGHQLRTEYDRRTGGASPLNSGQVYRTLERLERDGLVVGDGHDDEGHLLYAITAAGIARVEHWLASPVDDANDREALAVKVAIALSLPGTDLTSILEAQRTASEADLVDAERAARTSDDALRLLAAARAAHARADLAWIDAVAPTLPSPAVGQPLTADLPRRGRPPRPA